MSAPPDWFQSWYPAAFRAVQEKIGDPDESEAWLHSEIARAWAESSGTLVQTMEGSIQQLPQRPAADPPGHWDHLPENHRDQILATLNGSRPLDSEDDAWQLEQALRPDPNGQGIAPSDALRLWRSLTGAATDQEDNDFRHWVDADPRHLEAFEARYELWEQLRALPGAWLPDIEAGWRSIGGDASDNDDTSKRHLPHIRRLIFPAILLVITVLGVTIWQMQQPADVLVLDGAKGMFRLRSGAQVAFDPDSLELTGEQVVEARVTDSLFISAGTLIFSPGMYHLEHDESGEWELQVETGQLLLQTNGERFVIGEGYRLRTSEGVWLKEEE